jgi:hypothetical protein
MRRQEVSHLSFQEPKLRNADIYIYIYIYITLSSFRGFASRDFAICEDKRSRTWFPGSRNAETSKSIHAISFRGFYRDFISDPWDSRVPKRRNIKIYSALSFRGFHIGISHLANTRKLTLRISRVPKRRNIKIYSRSIISGFLTSGFRIWRIQGN